MKNSIFILLFCCFAGVAFAQQTKGRVSFDVKISSDDPQTAAYVKQMEGSTMELYFDENAVRSELMMGDFMTSTQILMKGQDTTLTLLDGMMGKIAMKSTEDDLEEEQRLALSKRRIDLIPDETKEIMGYTCNKAIVTTEDDKESIVWYTTEIVPNHREGQFLYEEIPGVPLMMEAFWGNMQLTLVAFEFKKKLKKPEVLFSMEVPKGYILQTMEDMKKMRQGG